MTSPGDGHRVAPEELRTFARGLDGRKADIGSAATTAGGVKLGGETFGELLQFFGNSAEELAADMVDKIEELAEAVDKSAQDVRAAATDYEQTDTKNKEDIGSLGGR